MRCCVRAGGLSGLPSSSARGCGALRTTRPTSYTEVLPSALGGGRDRARPSLGFGPVAGTRCRSSPCNRVAKSRTRRCQRSDVASPVMGKTKKSYHNPQPDSSEEFERLKFRARTRYLLQGSFRDLRHFHGQRRAGGAKTGTRRDGERQRCAGRQFVLLEINRRDAALGRVRRTSPPNPSESQDASCACRSSSFSPSPKRRRPPRSRRC